MSTAWETALPLRPADAVGSFLPSSVSNINHGAGTQKNFVQAGGYKNSQFIAETIHYHERTEIPPPPASTVPFKRDRDFIERPEINKLEERLSTGHTTVALVGLGGVGKSQLAIEHCFRTRDKSPDTWVLWIHASNAARFDEDIQKLASDVRIPGCNDPKADIFTLVYNWLRDVRHGKWLLVLDNADDATYLFEAPRAGVSFGNGRAFEKHRMAYIPICPHGSILITSRNLSMAAQLTEDYDIIVTNPMDEETALALLKKKLGRPSDIGEMQKLVVALDYMPLALAQAGVYIKQRGQRCSVRQYLVRLEKNEKSQTSLLKSASKEHRRDQEAQDSILRTWQISFDHIRASRSSAADLLSLMSFYNHQGVPEFLLKINYGNATSRLRSALGPDVDDQDSDTCSDSSLDESFEDDIMILRNFLFISIASSGKSFQMHRLVQLAARAWLGSQGLYREWACKSIVRLDKVFPTGEHKNWQQCLDVYPHLTAILKLDLDDRDASLCQASAQAKAAWFDWARGLGSKAEALAKQSFETRAKVLGIHDEKTLSSQHMLALALLDQSKHEAAEDISRQTLEGRTKVLGVEHLSTLASIDTLAAVLQAQAKYELAEKMQRQANEGFEKALGREHPLMLACINRLGLLLNDQGKYQAAEGLFRQALEGSEKGSTTWHPGTLIIVNNLAGVLQDQGEYRAAEEYFRRALEGREKVLGIKHPETLGSLNNLASVLRAQGMYEVAENMHRQAQESYREVLGENHRNTLKSASNLAETLRVQKKYDEAGTMHQWVLEKSENVLGIEHPDTLISVNNLAGVLRAQGKHDAAEKMHREALEGCRKVLGRGHPVTRTCSKNLQSLLYDQGKYEAAEEIYRWELETSEQVLGREHPDTLTSVHNLAELLRVQGKYAEAGKMHQRAVWGREKVLGQEDLHTIASILCLANVMVYSRRKPDAVLLYERAMVGMVATLGSKHQQTVECQRALTRYKMDAQDGEKST